MSAIEHAAERACRRASVRTGEAIEAMLPDVQVSVRDAGVTIEGRGLRRRWLGDMRTRWLGEWLK